MEYATKEVIGNETGVTGIKLINNNGDEIEKNLPGGFIAIGHKPNTDIFDGQLDMKDGYINIKSGTNGSSTETSVRVYLQLEMFVIMYIDKQLHLLGLAAWQHLMQKNI